MPPESPDSSPNRPLTRSARDALTEYEIIDTIKHAES